MPCYYTSLGSRMRSWLRDYDRIQDLAVVLIYIQVGCALLGSLGALFNGVLLVNLVVALFGLVTIDSSSQSLGRTYAVLLFCAILLDIGWFILFSHSIWNFSTETYGAFFVFSLRLALSMQIIGFSVRFLSSFLWIQMYRLGPASVDSSAYREVDYDMRSSFLNPSTNEIARQTSNSDECLGGAIYDPAYYSSLFEDGQDKGFVREDDKINFGYDRGSTSTTEQPQLKSCISRSFQLDSEVPSSTTPLDTTISKDDQLDVSLSQEDEMEEEAPDTTALSSGSFGGFGLGSTPSSSVPKPNPFGGSFLTANASTQSPPLTLTAPAGEPFRPASFSLPSMQPVQTSQPESSGGFSSSSGGGFSAFGQPAQMGVGQQALGTVLGTFGQARQLGSGMPSIGFGSSSSFSGGGFSTAANTGGFATSTGFAGTFGGFAGAATGGGFTSVASAGGGFAAAAKGGGFAALASGGGFAGPTSGGGFGAVSPPDNSFSMTAGAGGGFAGAGTGGFGAFGNNQGGGFSAFGGNNAAGAGKPPAQLFTQMRK